jgi:putative intracellular protease/amidase
MKKRVLCLLFPGFEEIETIAPVDLLRRAGVEVVVASLTGEKLVKGRCDITVQADASLADVAEQDFDLFVIPGGPGIKAVRADGRAAKLAERFRDAGKPVAAICAAPTVLKDAGISSPRAGRERRWISVSRSCGDFAEMRQLQRWPKASWPSDGAENSSGPGLVVTTPRFCLS